MKKITKLAIAASSALAVGTASAYGLCVLIDELLLNRKMVLPPEINRKISRSDSSHLAPLKAANMKWLEEYGYEKHYITSDRGEKLVGYLMKAKEPSDIYVFCSHGYRSEGKGEFCGFAQYYIAKGFNVFFPDHVASGESEGTYAGFGAFECPDCLKWLDYLRENFGNDIRFILHGVSMGAATVMLMSGNEKLPENVKMIVSDCGYTSAEEEFTYKLREMGVPPERLINAVNKINIKRVGYDIKSVRPIDAVAKAKVPMLFVHGSVDAFVPTYMAHLLYEACSSQDKDLLIIDNANHAHSWTTDKEKYEEKLDLFIEKFIK